MTVPGLGLGLWKSRGERFIMTMSFLMCFCAGCCWFVNAFLMGREAGSPVLGFIVGLILGVCVFCVTKIILLHSIRRLKLGETNATKGRLILSWLVCFGVLVFCLAAPWVLHAVARAMGLGVSGTP